MPPLLLNCGQEDSNVGGGHEEYLHNTEEVSDCISLTTARSVCAHAFCNCSWTGFKQWNASSLFNIIFEEKKIKAFVTS